MASVNYNSFFGDMASGNVVPGVDTFYAMLTNGYVPNKDTHAKRSDVTGEITGTGYTAGGKAVACTVSVDNTADQVKLTFANPSWPTATITADGAVIYKYRGGAATADELVGFVDFGGDVTATGGTFAVTLSAPLIIQN